MLPKRSGVLSPVLRGGRCEREKTGIGPRGTCFNSDNTLFVRLCVYVCVCVFLKARTHTNSLNEQPQESPGPACFFVLSSCPRPDIT